MKTGILIALCLAILSGTFCYPHVHAETPEVWMYAVSVGKADAILLGSGTHTALIDTGYALSRGHIQAAMKEMGVTSLDAVFLTHLDGDHTGGLTWLAESDLPIGAWYASAMYLDVESVEEHPMVEAAAIRGESVHFLQAGDSVRLGDAELRVLAPLEPATDKEDNNSLVMMLESEAGKILLAGDIEYPAERLLLASGADLKCDVLKVANHGDNDTNSPAFTQAVSPRVAVISTSSEEKAETPDPKVVRLLQNQGAEVAVTQECSGGILVRLTGGVPTVERISVPEKTLSLTLVSALPGDDLITLRNDGAEEADLTGCYLFSDRGKEMYAFPAGTRLASGASLTVGTRTSAQGTYDLYWDDKKVVHAKKEDIISLYDFSGNLLSSVSNGR